MHSDKPKTVSDNSGNVQNEARFSGNRFCVEYPEDGDSWFGVSPEDLAGVEPKSIDIGSLVDLDALGVEDCLSDEPPAALDRRSGKISKSNKIIEGQKNMDMSEEDWDFVQCI
ncbi:hypothetical protein RhiJN_17288 [Ceratobasidium sp. AG-Ba]|nr:hypothetical protein RhiJN_17288 [Ceratobasidium sp. AG-Ba]